MNDAPLDTPILLLQDGWYRRITFIGTLTKGNGPYPDLGECLDGDSEYFYRSVISAWKPYQ